MCSAECHSDLCTLKLAICCNCSVNSENGIKWRDDPAILAWNIMNEPRCDVAMRETCERDLHNWLHDMAGHIKSIDSNHLGNGC